MEEKDIVESGYTSQANAWEEVTPMLNPYDVPIKSDTNQRKVLAADAIALSFVNGTDPERAYAEVMSTDLASFKEGVVDQQAELEFNALKDSVGVLAMEDPALLTANVGAISDVYADVSEEFSRENRLAPYVAYVRNFPGSDQVSPDEIKSIAAQKYMLNEIAKLMDDDDYGIGAKSLDLLGVLAWPDMAYNVMNSVGSMVDDTTSLEAYLSTGDIVQKFAKALQKVEPEKRIEMFDILKSKLISVEDNKMKQVTLLLSAIGESTEGAIAVDAAFDKLDQLGIGFALGSGVVKTLKSVNSLRTITKIANSEREAAVLADVASRSDDAAATLGVARLDAVASGDPSAGAISTLLDGAPENIATNVRDVWREIDQRVAESSNVIQEGLGLTDAEKIAATNDRIKLLERQEGVTDVVGTPTEEGISLSFKTFDPKLNKSSDVDVTLPYTVDDVTGSFVQKGVTFLGEVGKSVLNSPNYLQGKDRDKLVAAFERITFGSAKVKNELNTAFNNINKGLSKDESINVSKILIKGDDESRTFTYKELVDDGIGGIKLTPKEFTAYAGTRKLMDELWALKNTETRRKLVAKGIKEVEVGDEIITAKPYDTYGKASAAYSSSNLKTVSIPQPLRGKATYADNLTPEQLQEYYDNGYSLVRTSESGAFVRAGDTLAEFALVPRGATRDLPMEVLNKRQGYIPRSYENAHFFVKQDRKINVSGRDTVVGTRTLRYFDNHTDAEKFIDELEQAAIDAGETFNRAEYHALGDREMQVASLDDDFIGMYGGMYSGARADEAIKFGLAGEAGKRVDALEAIQGYINHIGNRMPLAEYRLGIERRWMNHAKEHGAIDKSYNGSFRDALGAVEKGSGNPLVKTKLINAHHQIDYMNKVPSLGEQQWAGTIRALGKSMERFKGGKGLAKYLYRLDHSSPVDAIRGATFNLMLGTYNWSQVFVQASGAAVAMSIRPLSAPKAMSNMIAFGTLDNIHDAGAKAGAIEKISKIAGFENIAEEYALWQRSGMYESVVNTNADVASIYKGLPYDAGLVRKVWTNGTLPYKMGELANMRISFGTALAEWKSANKGKALDDNALKSVLQRTENFRLSMSRANTSEWQRGWLSIPTQFQQINARFFEALLGDQFSKMDKSMFLMGQYAMFGAAGVPFLDQAYGAINGWTGRDINNLSEEEIILERRGLLGWMVNHQLGIDADVTGRVAIASGVADQLIKMSTEPTELGNLLLGPSASTKDGLLNLVDSLIMTGKSAFNMDDLDATDAALLIQTNLTALAQLPASTRNLLLAHDLYGDNPVYRTRDGRARFDVDANMQTIISQAAGFQQVTKSDYWELVMGKKREMERLRGNVDRITNLYLGMVRYGADDERMGRAYRLAIDATIQSYPDEQDRIRLMHGVRDRLTKESDAVGKQVREILSTHTSQMADKGAVFNPLVIKELENARGTE